MRFIRRLLDRRPSVVVLAVCSLCAAAGASCSSSEEDGPLLPSDSLDAGAGPETSEPAVDAEVDGPPLRDAAAFDGGSRPVVCTSQPCAKSLVTTLPTMVLSGPSTIAPAEGFCALLDDGTVACWGANNDGQLGRGDDAGITESAIPARVVGLSNIVELAHNCARSASGDVWCWGLGVYVRGDAGAYASEPAPVRVPIPPAKRIGLGRLVGCAATDDGLLCWGQNAFLQIDPIPRGGLLPPTPVDLPPGAPIRDVVVGDATFVIREDGSTWSWGRSPPLGRVSSLDPDPHPAPTGLAARPDEHERVRHVEGRWLLLGSDRYDRTARGLSAVPARERSSEARRRAGASRADRYDRDQRDQHAQLAHGATAAVVCRWRVG